MRARRARERLEERKKRSQTVHMWSKGKNSHCREVLALIFHACLLLPSGPRWNLKHTVLPASGWVPPRSSSVLSSSLQNGMLV